MYYARLKLFMNAVMDMCGDVPPAAIESGVSKCGFYGDWSNPIVRFATTRDTGRIISNSYTILQLVAMSKLAVAVNNREDYHMYTTLLSKQRNMFDDYYWNETMGMYGNNNTFVQLTSVMALRVLYWQKEEDQNKKDGRKDEENFEENFEENCTGVCYVANETRRNLTKAALLRDIDDRGGKHSVGLIGWSFLLDVLSSVNAEEVALTLLKSEEYPSLGYMLKESGEGTTLWERWERPVTNEKYVSSMNNTSLNHPMFGSVYEWLVKYYDRYNI